MVIDAPPTYAPEHTARFRAAGHWRDESLIDWLTQRADSAPDRPAVVCGEVRLSYAELATRAAGLATGLRRLGIGPGDVVAVQLPNLPEFLIAYLAIVGAGAVMQTVHMPYRAAELESLLAHSQARALICLSNFRDHPAAATAVALKPRLPALAHVVAHGAAVDGTVALAALAAAAAEPLHRPRPADPCLLLYTSGTTASPKGVCADHRPFLANARLSAAAFGLGPDDVLLSAAPFSHLYGLFSLHLALAAGATTLMLPAFAPPDFARTAAAGRATMLFTGPAHCAALLNAGLFDAHDFGAVRFAVISGSPCPRETAATVDARLPNGRVLQLWGMTEIQAGTYTRPDDDEAARFTTIGAASPGNELRVVRDDGRTLGPGEEGELQIRGASVFAGYHRNPEATAEALTADGWFRSGDLATLDAAGRLVLTGRLKDVVNRGGIKFNPADIEAIVGRMPGVAACAVAPVPDPVLGERACAWVQLAPGARLTLEQITAELDRRGIAKIKWPERLVVVEAMPLTPTNKVIKSRLVRPGD